MVGFESGAFTASYLTSAETMRQKLETLGTGSLRVLHKIATNGHVWTVIFLDRLGNVPAITVDGDNLTGNDSSVIVAVTIPGRWPALDSSLAGSAEVVDLTLGSPFIYTISDLTAGVPYFITVSAWNGVGNAYGVTKYSKPIYGRPYRAPDTPGTLQTPYYTP